MVKNKKLLIKQVWFRAILFVLGFLGVNTVIGNFVFATEVFPSQTIENSIVSNNSNPIKNWLGSFVSRILDYFNSSKETLEKEYNYNIKNTFSENEYPNLENIKDYFTDISSDSNKYYINYFADKNFIYKWWEKFYPDNFIRLHEFTKILVNLYRYKVSYDLDSNVWLSDENYFQKTMPKYYNTAYEMWLLDWIENIEDFERFISHSDINKIIENFEKQYPNLLNSWYVISNTKNDTVSRWEACKIVFNAFVWNISNDTVYKDIFDHKNSQSIKVLEDLEIINTYNENFYPEQNISRWDFIVMLVKSYLKDKNLELNVSNIEFDIQDLDYNSIYAPYVVYAKENWIIDYLLEVKRWEYYIYLENSITKHEAYYIISKIAWIDLNYDILQADKEYITRWDTTKLLVDSFWLSTSKQNSKIEDIVNNVKSIEIFKKLSLLLS